MSNKLQRMRRARRTREKIKEMARERGTLRMVVHRSSQHIYVQILAPFDGKVLASASTLDKSIREEITSQSESLTKQGASKLVGKHIALKAKEAGIERVAFDRSGFPYHGRIASLVDAARENGLQV